MRWSKIVAAAIGLLLASGLYNILVISTNYTLPRWYNPLFGVKFILALGIFAIASFLSGRTPVADRMRRNVRFWLNLNIALALTVIALSGVLRIAEKVPKHPPVVEPTSVRPTAPSPSAGVIGGGLVERLSRPIPA